MEFIIGLLVFLSFGICLWGAWLIVCDKQRQWEERNKNE